MNLKELLFNELNCKEAFEIPTKLLEKLLSNDKKEFLSKVYDVYNFDVEDDLRDIFQSNQSDRKNLMQDYTPDCICKIMKGIIGDSNNLLDICSGTGALTLSIVSNNKYGYVQSEEISSAAIPYQLLNLALRNVNAQIIQKDVLTRTITNIYKLTKGEKFSNIEIISNVDDIKFDKIISNPPYSLKYEPIKDDTRIEGYEAPPKSRADYLFILDSLERLSDDGKAAFILPHGVLFRGQAEGRIRQKLIENNLIEAIIGLPEKLFMNTSIPTCIIVLSKQKKDKNILFINGDRTFVKGKKNNTISPEQIAQYVDTYNEKKEIEGFSRIVKLEEIKENEFNCNIPRYVLYQEPKEEINLDDVLKNLSDIENEIFKTTVSLKNDISNLVVYNDEGVDIDEEETKKYQQQMNAILDLLTFKNYPQMMNIINFLNDNNEALSNHTNIKITDIVDIERAKKNKIYPAGSIAIQMSATRGQMLFLEHEQEVESHYAVMQLKVDNIIPYYLYKVLNSRIEDFLKQYQTGLNITPDIFDFWEIPIHNSVNTQMACLIQLEQIEMAQTNSEIQLTSINQLKEFHLQKMFLQAECGGV